MKGAVAYLLFSVGRSNGFFLISVPSMRVVCFPSAGIVFANSFMLYSNLVLENSISGKCTSVTDMQDAPGSSLQSLIFLCFLKHVTIYDSGMLHSLFRGVGEMLWLLQVLAVANLICGLQLKCSEFLV